MPRRRVIALVLAALAVALGIGVGAVALTRSSPDPVRGDLVAYNCRETKNRWYAICVVGTDGTGAQRLTSKLATTDPAWSPDGRRIAFTRNEDTGESTTFTSDDVFVMDADGDDVRQLTPESPGRSLSQPTWSSDGTQLAYVDGESVHSSVSSRYGALFVIGDNGSDKRRLAGGLDADPDWSPDGREIVFVRGENLASASAGNDDLYVIDLATGAERQLTRTPPGTFEASPAWSPDGSRIAFARSTRASQFDGTASIHVVNRDGTGEKLVLEHKLYADGPYSLAWSPNGRTIAFETSSVLGCTSISTVGVEGGKARPLTTCMRPREASVAPAWQPAVDPAN